MRRSLLLLAAGLFCLGTARADELFTLTSGSNVISFTLPGSGPSYYNSMAFEYTGLTLDVNGTAIDNAGVDFYTAADGGGMEVTALDPILVNLEGSQMFSGSTADPDFLSQTFSLQTMYGSTIGSGLDVTVTAISDAPEPSTFALLGTGLLGMGGVIRRRWA